MAKRLLFLVTEDWYFISHRLPLALAAKAEGYDVAIACRINEDKETLESLGLTVFPLDIHRGGLNPFQDLKTLWQIGRIYRQWRPQVVHQVALKPVLYGSFWAKLLKIPKTVNAIAGLGILFVSQSFKAKILRTLILSFMRPLVSKTTLIVQNSHDHDILANALPQTDITLIPGAGVNIMAFKPSPATTDGPRLIFVARLLWSKGLGDLVAAIQRLQKKGHLFETWVVGEPDLDNADHIPAQQLQDWHDKGLIKWLGKRKDVAALYQTATIAVYPSYYGEGIPKTLLEAAACGKPIITTNHPGCRDVVAHGQNGLLVPPQSPDELATAIETILASPELCQQYGDKSRERAVTLFDETKIVTATLELYLVEFFIEDTM